jgi:hypothetical protein
LKVLRRTVGEGADVRLSDVELLMLNNALNEVCNGVHIPDSEFQTRLGRERDEMRTLLDEINSVV